MKMVAKLSKLAYRVREYFGKLPEEDDDEDNPKADWERQQELYDYVKRNATEIIEVLPKLKVLITNLLNHNWIDDKEYDRMFNDETGTATDDDYERLGDQTDKIWYLVCFITDEDWV